MKKFGYEKSFEYAEDYRIWHQIAQESKCANLPDYSVLYRIHESNISRLNRKKSNEGVKKFSGKGFKNGYKIHRKGAGYPLPFPDF